MSFTKGDGRSLDYRSCDGARFDPSTVILGADWCRPPKQNRVLIDGMGWGSPQTNLDPRLKLNSIGRIRIGSVIDQKGRKVSEGIQKGLRSSQDFSFQGFRRF